MHAVISACKKGCTPTCTDREHDRAKETVRTAGLASALQCWEQMHAKMVHHRLYMSAYTGQELNRWCRTEIVSKAYENLFLLHGMYPKHLLQVSDCTSQVMVSKARILVGKQAAIRQYLVQCLAWVTHALVPESMHSASCKPGFQRASESMHHLRQTFNAAMHLPFFERSPRTDALLCLD